MRQPIQIALVILGAFLIFELRLILVLCVIALTLAAALAPIAEFFEKKRVPRAVTILSLYALVVLAYVLIGASVVRPVKIELLHLWENVPKYAQGLSESYKELQMFLGEHAGLLDINYGDMQGVLLRVVPRTLHLTADFSALVLNIIFVLFLGSYLAIDAPHLWPAILQWVPEEKRETVAGLIRPLEQRLGGYIRGQLLVSLFVGAFLGIALSIIKLDYALLLGIIAAVMNFVPYIGSITVLGFAIFLASQQSLLLVGITLVVFAVEQWIESSIIVPVCLGKQTGLHPLVVLLGIICGATLMGLPGAMASIPILSALLFLAERFYLKRDQAVPISPQTSS